MVGAGAACKRKENRKKITPDYMIQPVAGFGGKSLSWETSSFKREILFS